MCECECKCVCEREKEGAEEGRNERKKQNEENTMKNQIFEEMLFILFVHINIRRSNIL